jgi:hypothetical protein
LPEIDRQQAQGKEVAFRGDAAFARPEVYEAHEARLGDAGGGRGRDRGLKIRLEISQLRLFRREGGQIW